MLDKFGVAFGEASTWRGIIALLTIVGVKLDPTQTEAIVTAGVALYAAVAIFTKRNPGPVK